MDTDEGTRDEPLSLNKLSYCEGNPISGSDPSGCAIYYFERPLNSGLSGLYNESAAHSFLLFTSASDPGSNDPFDNRQSVVATFSFHPNKFDYRKSIKTAFSDKAPGRVWESDEPVDTEPKHSQAILLSRSNTKSDQENFLHYLNNWIKSNPVGYEKGPEIPDPSDPSGNFRGGIEHKDAPNQGAIYYSVGEQNCVWWATVMLKSGPVKVDQSVYNWISSCNYGIGAAKDVISGKRKASTQNTISSATLSFTTPGYSDIGALPAQ